jgi:flagellar assembly protein FliH
MTVKLNVKIDKKIVGLQHRDISVPKAARTYDAEDYKRKLSQSGEMQTDKQFIKTLKDRLHVLEQELQKAREESFQAGFEEGKERGYADASKDIKHLTTQLEAMEDRFSESMLKMEIPLLELAQKMAEKVIKKELQSGFENDDLVLEAIRKGLHEVIDEHKVLIRLNPDQLQSLGEIDLKQDLNMQGNMNVNLVGDKSLQKGETIIESENYVIDGTYSAQLAHLKDQMVKEVSE